MMIRRYGKIVAPLALLVVAGIAGAASGVAAPPGSADLSITKTASPNPVAAGGALTYKITLANAGPDAATNVIMSDHLPTGVTFGSATSTQGSCSQAKGVVTCPIGTMGAPPGQPVEVTIQVKAPDKGGKITNTAAVRADQKDPNNSNDKASATTTVNPPPAPLQCASKTATIIGTAAGERLNGTGKADVVVARGGNDLIRTFGGNDVICAGGGSDQVKSGSGTDIVNGGAGNDLLRGMAGNDTLRGQTGDDRLRGGRGGDLLVGGTGDDVCTGGAGGDTVRGC
ncbi:MAG TPA: hypothetical protein VHU24_06940 [Solirubrobacterales bacterium]|jgi:uncharacterized repeat protein (TIGR01451 family)|nr:hypothetical protein [Solirubrobacterales bacterium]